MKKLKNKHYRFKLIFILPIIVFALILLVFFYYKNTFLEKIVKDAGVNSIKILSYPVKYVGRVINVNKIYNENEKLKSIKSDDSLRIENDNLKSELSEIKDRLELNTLLSEYNSVASTVVTRNLSSWNRTAIIDKGKKDGLRDGYAVINKYGLVGYLKNTSYTSSSIKLLTSPNEYKISIKIEVDGYYVYGLITGYDEENNELIIEGISENTVIPANSFVLTSGLGNEFPSGILIGNVVSEKKDNFDLSRTIRVKPAVDFNDITYVLVLTKGDIK